MLEVNVVPLIDEMQPFDIMTKVINQLIQFNMYLRIYDILYTRVGTLIVATIYLQLIQNRYMFRSFTVLHCSHQHCVQPLPAMWKS